MDSLVCQAALVNTLDSAEPTGRVLVVCTGNVCRSPFIEGILRLQLPPSIQVASAGTAALAGEPVDPRVSAALGSDAANSSRAAARQLTPEIIHDAQLVLTATRAHRGAVASLHPRALGYTFAFGDFSALARAVILDDLGEGDSPADVLRRKAAAVAGQRGLAPPKPVGEVDIVDPYRRDDRVFAAMVAQVLEGLPPVLRLLVHSTAVDTRLL